MAEIGFKRNVTFAVAEIARNMSFRERSDYGLNHVSSDIAFLKCTHARTSDQIIIITGLFSVIRLLCAYKTQSKTANLNL